MCKDDKQLASIAVTNIGNFLAEFEGMVTKPNIVIIQETYVAALKKYYPYMIKDNMLFYNNYEFKIISIVEDFIGLSFSLYFEDLSRGEDEDTLSKG